MPEPTDRKRFRRRFVLVFLVILLLLQLTVLLPRGASPPPPFSWILKLVPATSGALVSVGDVVEQGWNTYVKNVGAAKEVERLQRENERLRFALWWSNQQLDQRRRLDTVYGWAPRPWQGAIARVVRHDPAERYHNLWIRAPEARSLDGAAVLFEGSLLGRVVRTYGRYGQVLLIHDAESSVDVQTTSGVRGIARGTGGASGRLEFVPRYESLAVGDVLVTTGRDAAFPSGLTVGVVATVDRDPERLYLDATVRFAARPAAADWVRTVPAPELPAAIEPQ